ncbi:TIGR02099 family protein [Roseateles sp. YR242]|uniref:YhdP family protein n=1 Tax=Roseateles sp. YR242 TaxID=1855305 RepID=UPI0008D00D83|nr:YhdP family protein [Roseateles sp. YR242]SEL78630.1 TIGR02099 family protein [Roseateles sp. YR242]
MGPLLGLLALLLTAWLALQWAILPHIDDWRPELEKQATRALGIQVHIGSIKANSTGWIPALDLRDVRLTDPSGREALRLPRVNAALSARSLLVLELRFSQLLLDSPELLLRRDAQGRVFIAGLSVDGPQNTSTSDDASDWFFQQHEFVILHGRIRWVDELRQAPPLELFDLNLVLRNGLRRHQLRLDATPPAGWGERFSLRGQFTQSLLARPGAVQQWSGQLYADLPRTDVRELRRYLDLPFELNEGDGALRAWLDVNKGQPSSLTLDMGLRAVKLRVAPALPELDLARIEGRLVMKQTPDQFVLQARQLGFRAGDGLDWPRSDWALELKRDGKTGQVTGGDFEAQQLDLTLGAQILSRLPVGEAPRTLVADMKPAGLLNALQVHWDGPLEHPRSYRAKGQLQGLHLAAAELVAADDPASAPATGRPGVNNADLQFDATDQGGTASLTIKDGDITLPGVFEEATLPLRHAQASLTWRAQTPEASTGPGGGLARLAAQAAQQSAGQRASSASSVASAAQAPAGPVWTVQFNKVRLITDDLQADLDGTWQSSGAVKRPHDIGRLDLTGHIEEVRADRVLRYLPASMGSDARRYVRDAIRDGTVHKVAVRMQGDLADFPFDAPRSKGIFKISSQVRDLTLAYVPSHPADESHPAFNSPWPAMDQLNAELIFDRASMSIRNGRARLSGVELSNVQGQITDLYHHSPVLDISGEGRGALADALRYVHHSPISELTSHALDNTVASGPMSLKLALKLPLAHIDDTTVKGQVLLTGNDMRLRPDAPFFAQTRARIDFDQKGVQIRGGQARVLGGDATFEGGSLTDGSMRFVANGTVTAEALRNAPELGLGPHAASVMTGQAAVRFELGINKGQTEIALTSSLQGIGIDLPAPLRKGADETWPLKVSTRAIAAPAGAQREELRVEAGPVAAVYQRDITGESARVLRGAVAVGEKLPDLPAQGVIARAALNQFNADAWQSALPRLMGSTTTGLGAGNGTDTAADSAAEGAYAPSQLALKVQTLQMNGRTLNRVVAGLTHDSAANTWSASIDAEQLSGFIQVRLARPNQPGRVFARLARLSVPKTDADSVEQLLDSQPSSIPTLDILVENFELKGKRLGRLEIEAQQQTDARDWKLNKLLLKNEDATLSATGQWAPEAAGKSTRRTDLDWKLDVVDAGKLLERMGQGQVLRHGKGTLTGQLAWQGSPLSLDYPSMTGKLKVSMDAGQFLKAEPGVGRLLGVLSLQSIPRRLTLDFRDVFSEGFAFDNVGGDIQIAKGVARSDNLRMRGLAAAVLMEGSADLAAETQDLHVLVVPEINAGGAALAYAAINPAIGLGTFLAQWLLRKPIAAASTEEFRVTGSWSDPKIEQLPRRALPQSAPQGTTPDGKTGTAQAASPPHTEGDSAP